MRYFGSRGNVVPVGRLELEAAGGDHLEHFLIRVAVEGRKAHQEHVKNHTNRPHVTGWRVQAISQHLRQVTRARAHGERGEGGEQARVRECK